MRRIISALLMIFAYVSCDVYALDWIRLHEEADKKNIQEALLSVKMNPDSLGDLYVLGLVYLNDYKDAEAYEIFNKILAQAPDTTEAQWGRAEVLRRRKEIEESEKLLNKIIKSNPQFSPAYISLAYLKYTQANFNEAVRLTQKVKKQGEDNVDVSNLTRAYSIFAGAKGMNSVLSSLLFSQSLTLGSDAS